jgi:hypothetical protein
MSATARRTTKVMMGMMTTTTFSLTLLSSPQLSFPANHNQRSLICPAAMPSPKHEITMVVIIDNNKAVVVYLGRPRTGFPTTGRISPLRTQVPKTADAI